MKSIKKKNIKLTKIKKSVKNFKSPKSVAVYDTLKFQIRKDSFKSNEYDECKKSVNYSIQTNPRFKKFNQIHFTAGDYFDIEKYIYKPIIKYFSEIKLPKKLSSRNLYINYPIKYSKLFTNLNFSSLKWTIDYIFKKFKKCIFAAIKDNKLVCFLQLSNINYKNDFLQYLAVSKEDSKVLEQIVNLEKNPDLHKNHILQHKYKKLNDQAKLNLIKFLKKKNYKGQVEFNRRKWIANNGFFRNDYPYTEGDKLVPEYKDLLITTLEERKIPDCIFFINIRDFPLINDDLTEPYYHLFNTKSKLISPEYHHSSFIPILSRSVTSKSADLLLPTEDDWRFVSNKIYPDRCETAQTQDFFKTIELDWNKKKSIGVFVGSSTGCGITIDDNQRLKLADLSLKYPNHVEAGITNFNQRLKKYMNKYLDLINPNDFNFKQVKKKTKKEISEYKYIIVVDGHVSAFRLSYELASKSVVLLVESEYVIWFQHLLKPYDNFIPINSDLSNLIDVINWCRENDQKCKKIAINAYNLYHKYLTRNGFFDYMQVILTKISENMDHNFLEENNVNSQISS